MMKLYCYKVTKRACVRGVCSIAFCQGVHGTQLTCCQETGKSKGSKLTVDRVVLIAGLSGLYTEVSANLGYGGSSTVL